MVSKRATRVVVPAAVAVVALALAYREEVEATINVLTGRTPAWLYPLILKKSWLAERPMCAEGAMCTFQEHDFWSPENRTLNQLVLNYFFWVVAPEMKAESEAVSVALHKRYLRRMGWGGVKPEMGFIFVGPNVLHDGEVTQLAYYNDACGKAARLVLVEPQEPIIRDLTMSALKIGMGPERTSVINAAMCPSADDSLSLWKFKEDAAPVIRRPVVTKWSTLGGKDALMNTWRRNVMFENWPIGDRHEDDLEDWLVEIPVKCHTAASLLQDVRMQVESVDYLFIDAEGYDAEILGSFTDLPGFNPAVIIFEWGFHHASRGKLHMLPAIANRWSRKGYAVYKSRDNIVMFRTDGN